MKINKPKVLWVGNLRVNGGISVVTDRFIKDPTVNQNYLIKVQDQSFFGEWNEISLLKYVKIPRGILLIIWNCLSFNPIIVHIHTSYKDGFLRDGIMALLAKVLGKIVIITFHPGNSLIEDYNNAPFWLKHLTNLVIPHLDAIIALGKSYQTFLIETFHHPCVYVIPNAVDDEGVTDESQDYLQREKIVFFAGLLDGRKGALDLIKAAEKVHINGVRFIIKGRTLTKKDKNNLEKIYGASKVKQIIQIEGWGPVFNHLKQARVLVLPSYGESLPLILEEAIVYGLPVIATPVGVIPDYIIDGIHGHLITPGDIDGLAGAIEHILSDDKWALQASRANIALGQMFLRSKVHEQVMNVYQALICSSQGDKKHVRPQ